jgi:hypothetical protein
MIFSAVTDSIVEKCVTAFGGNLCLFLMRFIAQRLYTLCTRTNYKIVPVTNFINIYTVVQVELNNMCRYMYIYS